MVSGTNVLAARASLAANERHHPDANHSHLRRDLAAAKLAQYVERVVSTAPPLTPEQRDRIAALLRPTGGVAA